MDQRELLVKYIQHVIECEGTSFIPFDKKDRVRYSEVEFSEEELEELHRILSLLERRNSNGSSPN